MAPIIQHNKFINMSQMGFSVLILQSPEENLITILLKN